MDRRQKMSAATVSVVIAVLALSFVTASALAANTPLFTVRMEQASSKMSFLPTAVNGFTYTVEKGYNLNYDICSIHGGVKPSRPTNFGQITCEPLCEPTEQGYYTCDYTCWYTCPNTCVNTCPVTCDDPTCVPSCQLTCQSTCPDTCEGPTCPWTCGVTHWESCEPTCEETICPPECPP